MQEEQVAKDLDYYLGLPYKWEIEPDEEGGFVVQVPDLPGCISSGETILEAAQMIGEAKELWLETALDRGWSIPEPGDGQFYKDLLHAEQEKNGRLKELDRLLRNLLNVSGYSYFARDVLDAVRLLIESHRVQQLEINRLKIRLENQRE
jgi:predicted RNase H-like HicB family nuclease